MLSYAFLCGQILVCSEMKFEIWKSMVWSFREGWCVVSPTFRAHTSPHTNGSNTSPHTNGSKGPTGRPAWSLPQTLDSVD